MVTNFFDTEVNNCFLDIPHKLNNQPIQTLVFISNNNAKPKRNENHFCFPPCVRR